MVPAASAGRPGPWLTSVLAAALLCAGLAACGSSGPAPAPALLSTPTAASPAAPSTGRNGAPSARWHRTALISGMSVSALIGGPAHLYGIAGPTPSATASGPTRLFRLDVATGRVTWGPARPGLVDDALAGGWLWALAQPPPARPQPGPSLLRVDRRTLRVDRVVGLAGVDGALAGAPAGPLWVGTGSRLYRVAPSSAAVTASFAVPGTVSGLSLDPAGRRLYLSANHRAGGATVEERRAVDGAPVASRYLRFETALGVSGAPGGVWAWLRGGMAGSAVLLGPRDLALAPLPTLPPRSRSPLASRNGGIPGSPFAAIEGVEATVSAGVLWLSGGIGYLVCADPTTGTVRGFERHDPISSEVTLGRRVYVGVSSGLVALQLPAACLG